MVPVGGAGGCSEMEKRVTRPIYQIFLGLQSLTRNVISPSCPGDRISERDGVPGAAAKSSVSGGGHHITLPKRAIQGG